jgi:hypothetical protein
MASEGVGRLGMSVQVERHISEVHNFLDDTAVNQESLYSSLIRVRRKLRRPLPGERTLYRSVCASQEDRLCMQTVCV